MSTGAAPRRDGFPPGRCARAIRDCTAPRRRPVRVRSGHTLALIARTFNLTNADSLRDPATASLLFNLDGTIRTGLGNPRRGQLSVRYVF